jgi:O-antigen/teichoic acid export membrane protein
VSSRSGDAPTGPGRAARLAFLIRGQRSLLLNAGSLFGATLLTAAIGGLYWALAARTFAPAAVGLAAAAISAMQLTAQLSTFGLGTVLMGELSEHRGAERRLINSALGIAALVGLVLAVAFTAVAGVFVPELGRLRAPAAIVLFAVGVATTAVGLVLDQALLGLLRGGLQLLRNGLASLVKLAALVVVGLAVVDRSEGLLVFLTWVIGGVASMIVLAALPRRGADPGRPVWRALEGVGGLAVRHHLLNLAILAPGLLLPLVITGVLSAEANAYFYIAFLIASFGSAVPAALATAVYAAGARDLDRLVSRVRLAFGLSIATAVAVNVVLLVAAGPILSVFGAAYAANATTLLRLFGLGIFPITLNSLFVPIARVELRFLRGAALMVLSMVIEIAFVIAGARLGGLQGSATGWVVGYAVSVLPFIPTLVRVGVRGDVRPIRRDILGALPAGRQRPARPELWPAEPGPWPAGADLPWIVPDAIGMEARSVAIAIVTDGPGLSRWQAAVVRAIGATDGVGVAGWLHLGLGRPAPSLPVAALGAVPVAEMPERLAAPQRLTTSPPSASGSDPRSSSVPEPDVLLDLTTEGLRATEGPAAVERWRFTFGRRGAGDPVRAAQGDLAAGTGGTLVRLVTDDGVVLHEGVVKRASWSVPAHANAILFDTAGWPAQAAARRSRASVDVLGARPADRQQVADGRRSGVVVPTGVVRLGLGARRVAASADVLLRHSDWNVGLVDAPIEDFLTGRPPDAVRWLPTRPGRYAADPFGVERGGTLHLFFEDYDQRRERGVISHLALAEDGPVGEPEPVLVPGGHVSYPFLIEADGEVWMVPETADELELRLYRAIEFPTRWRIETVLLPGVPVADPTVVPWAGQWWLFGTSRGRGVDHALRLWHAPALAGPWRLHRLDPVKVDARSARPAGTPFVVDGAMFRPSQDSSRRYGGRVVINRVDVMTATEFLEQPVVAVEPLRQFGRPDGIHTLSAVGRRTLVDGNVVHLVPAALRGQLARGIARLPLRSPRP